MEKLPRIPSPPGTAFREFRIAVLPGLVFVLVLGLTVFTWRNYVGPSQLVGEVEAVRATVSANEAGVISTLQVGLLDRVTNGQVLVQFSPGGTRRLGVQLAISRARDSNLRDAIDNRLRQERNEFSYRQFMLSWLDQRAELASLKAQQGYFRAELDRQELLVGDKASGGNPISSIAQYEIAKRDYDSLTAQIEERTRLVSELEAAMTKQRESDVDGKEVSDALRTAQAAEAREIEALEAQAQVTLVNLISPIDGVVSAVNFHPGENVAAEEAILTISGMRPERVITFLRQPLNLEVRTNMAVEVRSRARHREAGMGRVLSVGTQLEPILPQLMPRGANPNLVEYGLPVLVSLPPHLSVLAGEVVDLSPLPAEN